MPTMEWAAISATPVMGRLRKERPITSAQISSIRPKVQTVPMAASASSSIRIGSKGWGAASRSSAETSMSSAMVCLRVCLSETGAGAGVTGARDHVGD